MSPKRSAFDANADFTSDVVKKQKIDNKTTTATSMAASTKAFDITELLEMVLLDLDSKSLLLAQQVSKKFQDVIRASANIQKKLFFVQLTFDEALQLGLIDDDTIICAANPGEFALLNPLLLDVEWDRKLAQQDGHLPKSILFDTISSRRGISSWERMYGSTLMKESWLRGNFWITARIDDVKLSKIQPRHKYTPKVGEEAEMPSDMLWAKKTMRELMDQAEEDLLDFHGMMFRWSTATFKMCGCAMRYSLSKKVERFALLTKEFDWVELREAIGSRDWDIDDNKVDKALAAHAM